MSWDELPDGLWLLICIAIAVIIETCIIQWPRIAEYMGWAQ